MHRHHKIIAGIVSADANQTQLSGYCLKCNMYEGRQIEELD
jgi:hypothetical protein